MPEIAASFQNKIGENNEKSEERNQFDSKTQWKKLEAFLNALRE